ncbi:MAG: carboxylesterase family protein [Ginsengibacter sp.]
MNSVIDRRKFLSNISLATAALTLPGVVYSSLVRSNDYVEAKTTHGRIRGIRKEGVNIFKGVPYAGKTSGDRRFRRPAKLESWTGVRDALTLGAPAIQPPRMNEPAPSEDCLFLNVWTPANDNKRRPVMFYNHGGGYVIGSAGAGGQNGANLARNFDVVVVETNHRLGLFGFLYLDEIAGPEYAGSGNSGLLDIIDGLKWANDNISQFGGDPNNVMIWGESGGGGKTSCLYAMPGAAPYFNKASIESGPGVRMMDKRSAQENTLQVLKELDISTGNWKKLLEVPVADLMAVQAKLPFVAPFLGKNKELRGRNIKGFGPVVDGITLPQNPFDPTAPKISRNKPLIVGWNEDEYNFFAWERKETEIFKIDFDGLYRKLEPQYGQNTNTIIQTYRKTMPAASASDIFVAVSSITMMGLGSIEIAEKKSKENAAPVYLYNFGYKSEVKIPGTDHALGTPHAMDITFKFNNEVQPKKGESAKPGFFAGNRPERFIASHHFAELWTTYARTGKPSAKNVPEWPAYNLNDRPTMRIDTKCEVIYDRFKEELDMWRSIGKLG